MQSIRKTKNLYIGALSGTSMDSIDVSLLKINKKIKKAKSDSESIPDDIKQLEKKPEALNLLNIYAELSKTTHFRNGLL